MNYLSLQVVGAIPAKAWVTILAGLGVCSGLIPLGYGQPGAKNSAARQTQGVVLKVSDDGRDAVLRLQQMPAAVASGDVETLLLSPDATASHAWRILHYDDRRVYLVRPNDDSRTLSPKQKLKVHLPQTMELKARVGSYSLSSHDRLRHLARAEHPVNLAVGYWHEAVSLPVDDTDEELRRELRGLAAEAQAWLGRRNFGGRLQAMVRDGRGFVASPGERDFAARRDLSLLSQWHFKPTSQPLTMALAWEVRQLQDRSSQYDRAFVRAADRWLVGGLWRQGRDLWQLQWQSAAMASDVPTWLIDVAGPNDQVRSSDPGRLTASWVKHSSLFAATLALAGIYAQQLNRDGRSGWQNGFGVTAGLGSHPLSKRKLRWQGQFAYRSALATKAQLSVYNQSTLALYGDLSWPLTAQRQLQAGAALTQGQGADASLREVSLYVGMGEPF